MTEVLILLAVVAVVALLGIRHGRKAERARLERDYLKTREGMTDAETRIDGFDDDAVLERLRHHAGNGRVRRD